MTNRSSNIHRLATHFYYQSALHLLRKTNEYDMDFDIDDDEELEDDATEFFDDEDEDVSLAD